VPAGDVRALHDALAELLADPATRHALAERGRSVARERYAWQDIGARTLALYRRLLGDNGAR
jgi:glycosyltransferase involved in cell wall biosynthesis